MAKPPSGDVQMPALIRFARAALAALAFMLFATPGYAGPAETAFLEQYVGTWTAAGQMSGAETGKISCKITFKAGKAKVNFSGRCSFTGMGSQSFTGTLTYNDAKKRYESKSPGKVAVGVRSGDTLVFTSTAKNPQGASTSAMHLGPSALGLDTTLTSKDGVSTVHLTFKKS
jgi:hypothetical protein